MSRYGEQLYSVDTGYIDGPRVVHSELQGHAPRDTEVRVGGNRGSWALGVQRFGV